MVPINKEMNTITFISKEHTKSYSIKAKNDILTAFFANLSYLLGCFCLRKDFTTIFCLFIQRSKASCCLWQLVSCVQETIINEYSFVLYFLSNQRTATCGAAEVNLVSRTHCVGRFDDNNHVLPMRSWRQSCHKSQTWLSASCWLVAQRTRFDLNAKRQEFITNVLLFILMTIDLIFYFDC